MKIRRTGKSRGFFLYESTTQDPAITGPDGHEYKIRTIVFTRNAISDKIARIEQSNRT